MAARELSRTVGQLVVERPERARVFESFGIDYCCGGRLPLPLACAREGVGLDSVLRALDAVDAGEILIETGEWLPASLGDRIDRIVAVHHGHLRRDLPRLSALMDKVAHAHGEGHPELGVLRAVFSTLRRDLESHMLDEEQRVFPAIRRLDDEPSAWGDGRDVEEAIRDAESEHELVGKALARIRALTDRYRAPASSCNTYGVLFHGLAALEADLHRHVHEENNLLFPRALEIASAGWVGGSGHAAGGPERRRRSSGTCASPSPGSEPL